MIVGRGPFDQDASPAAFVLESAGATLAVLGALAAYHYFTEKELKEYKAAIEKINVLHQRHLEKILVKGHPNAKVLTLPPIFSKVSGEEKPQANVLLKMPIIEDLYNSKPIFSDPILRHYTHHVLTAMRQLADYYKRRIKKRMWFFQGNENDITSGVLSYLILMLSQHCVKFEGYNVDIAYLEAISDFVSDFASLEEGAHRERLEQLTEVTSALAKAKAILEHHRLSLSMEELIGQFQADSGRITEDLIRSYIKAIMPNDKWDDVDCANMEFFAARVVTPRYEYQNRNIPWPTSEISLPKCLFSYWIQHAATDYVRSLSLTKKDLIPIKPGKAVIPDFNTDPEDLKNIKKVFTDSVNILTQQIKHESGYRSVKNFTPVEETAEIAKRAKVYFDLYQLIDRIIVAQYFCLHIWWQLKELGERYFRDSQECDLVFQVLAGLGAQIEKLADKLLIPIRELQVLSTEALHTHPQNMLTKKFISLLESVKGELYQGIRQLVEKHNTRQALDFKEENPVPKLSAIIKKRRKQSEEYLDKHVNCPIRLKKDDILLILAVNIKEAYEIDIPTIVVDANPELSEIEPLEPSKVVTLAEKILNRRKDQPDIDALYIAIHEMLALSKKLATEDPAKGLVAKELAEALETKLNQFIDHLSQDCSPYQLKAELLQFKDEFSDLLHSRDEQMAAHRAAWKPIVANIAIALTGLGLVALLGYLLMTKLSTGHAAFFFEKTHRQQQVDKVEQKLNQVCALPG